MFALPIASTKVQKSGAEGRGIVGRGVDRLHRLNLRFPTQAGAIRSRMRVDPSFRELCQDFEAAAAALDYWQAPSRRSAQRIKDYRDLVSELEMEIEAALGA